MPVNKKDHSSLGTSYAACFAAMQTSKWDLKMRPQNDHWLCDTKTRATVRFQKDNDDKMTADDVELSRMLPEWKPRI